MDNNIDMSPDNLEYKSFELTLCVRDRHGNLTGETKTICTNSSDELSEFWELNQVKKKGKAKIQKKAKA